MLKFRNFCHLIYVHTYISCKMKFLKTWKTLQIDLSTKKGDPSTFNFGTKKVFNQEHAILQGVLDIVRENGCSIGDQDGLYEIDKQINMSN